MRLMSLQLWQHRICNKYTKYAVYLIMLLILSCIFKHEIHVLAKIIVVFLYNTANDPTSRQQIWSYILSGNGAVIVALLLKKEKKDEDK